jgi:vacuole morphology and inheritance protein 14
MLLPQSSAFAALKNRLNSVSAIGYLHIAPRTNAYVHPSSSSPNLNHLRQKSSEVGSSSGATASGTPGSFGETRNRIGLKPREDDGKVKWVELLDRFKQTQEKARRSQRIPSLGDEIQFDGSREKETERMGPPAVQPKVSGIGRPASPALRGPPPLTAAGQNAAAGHKARSSLSLGRFAGGVGGRKKK